MTLAAGLLSKIAAPSIGATIAFNVGTALAVSDAVSDAVSAAVGAVVFVSAAAAEVHRKSQSAHH